MPDRLQERKELIRKFEAGQSVQMLGPRRIGKTWVMHEVGKDLAEKGWVTVNIDVAGMRNERGFMSALCRRLQQANTLADNVLNQLRQRIGQLSTGGEFNGTLLEAVAKVDPKQFSEVLVETLNSQGKETLILVDEISLFVMELVKQEPHTASAFLYHLRRLQQNYPHVRWLLTGSIGLDVVARRHDMAGALVDLEIFTLKPFTKAVAQHYVEERCKKGLNRHTYRINAPTFAHLASELGWLAPFYLGLVTDQIEPSGPAGEDGVPTALRGDIDQAIAFLLRPEQRVSFSTWDEHLSKNFPPHETKQLETILDACSEDPAGEQGSTLLARLHNEAPELTPRHCFNLLTALHNAGILEDVSGEGADRRWRFRSGLFRRYWQRYHV